MGTQEMEPLASRLASYAGQARRRASTAMTLAAFPPGRDDGHGRMTGQGGSFVDPTTSASAREIPAFSNRMKRHRQAARACHEAATALPTTRHAEMMVTTSGWLSLNELPRSRALPETAKDWPSRPRHMLKAKATEKTKYKRSKCHSLSSRSQLPN